MKYIGSLLAIVLGLGIGVAGWADNAAEETLSAFHRAGAEGDSESLLRLLTDDAVFLGVDTTARLQGQQLRRYFQEQISHSTPWKFHSRDRYITTSTDGNVAWFDEALTNKQPGDYRGTGILVRTANGWLIAQYNLSQQLQNAMTPAPTVKEEASTTPAASANSQPANSTEASKDGDNTTDKPPCRKKRHKTNTRAKC